MQAKRRPSTDRVEGANGEINLVQMEKKHLEEPDSQNGKISFYTVRKGEILEDTNVVLEEDAGEKETVEGCFESTEVIGEHAGLTEEDGDVRSDAVAEGQERRPSRRERTEEGETARTARARRARLRCEVAPPIGCRLVVVLPPANPNFFPLNFKIPKHVNYRFIILFIFICCNIHILANRILQSANCYIITI